MNMEMTFEEKIKRVELVINEALTVQKTNPIHILKTYFSKEELGFINSRDVFRVLREKGIIKDIEGYWGFEEIQKNKKQIFRKTSSEEPIHDDDLEYFKIEIDLKKWAAEKKLLQNNSVKNITSIENLIFTKEGKLYSKDNPTKIMVLGKGTGRYKIFNALIDAKGEFVSTDKLREISGKKNNRAVHKEMGAIKYRIFKRLAIKKDTENKIIEGSGFNGYRLLLNISKGN